MDPKVSVGGRRFQWRQCCASTSCNGGSRRAVLGWKTRCMTCRCFGSLPYWTTGTCACLTRARSCDSSICLRSTILPPRCFPWSTGCFAAKACDNFDPLELTDTYRDEPSDRTGIGRCALLSLPLVCADDCRLASVCAASHAEHNLASLSGLVACDCDDWSL